VLDSKPRHVNPKMEQELKNYQQEVEAKFKLSQMKQYEFPRITPKQSEPAVSSKDILKQLLNKYQQLQSDKKPTPSHLRKSSSLLGQAKNTVPPRAKSKSKASFYKDQLLQLS
jgi:hypothetical protein